MRALWLLPLVTACSFAPLAPGRCEFDGGRGCRPGSQCLPTGECREGTSCTVGEALDCEVDGGDGRAFVGRFECTAAGWSGVCETTPCALQLGVCAGSRLVKGDSAGCTSLSYGPRYTVHERCPGAPGEDDDCDGLIDEVDLPNGEPTPCGVGLCLTRDADGGLKSFLRCGERSCDPARLERELGPDGYRRDDECAFAPDGSYGLDSNCDGVQGLSPAVTLLENVQEASVAAGLDGSIGGAVFLVAASVSDGGSRGLMTVAFNDRLERMLASPVVEVDGAGPLSPSVSRRADKAFIVAYRSESATIQLSAFAASPALIRPIPLVTIDAGRALEAGPSLAAVSPESGSARQTVMLAWRNDAGTRIAQLTENGTLTFVDEGYLSLVRSAVVTGEGSPQASVVATFISLGDAGTFPPLMTGLSLGAQPVIGGGVSMSLCDPDSQVVGVGQTGVVQAGVCVFNQTAPLLHFADLRTGASGLREMTRYVTARAPDEFGPIAIAPVEDAGRWADGGTASSARALVVLRDGPIVRGVSATAPPMELFVDAVSSPLSAWSPVVPQRALVAARVAVDGGTNLVGRLACMPPPTW